MVGKRTEHRVFIALDADQAGAGDGGYRFDSAVKDRHPRHQGIALEGQRIGDGQVLHIGIGQFQPQRLAACFKPDVEFGKTTKALIN